jgi:hypothetical protein
MQCLSIFVTTEGIYFEFTSLIWFWILEKNLQTGWGPLVSTLRSDRGRRCMPVHRFPATLISTHMCLVERPPLLIHLLVAVFSAPLSLYLLLLPPLSMPWPATAWLPVAADVVQEHCRLILVLQHLVRSRAAGCNARHERFPGELIFDWRAPSSSGSTQHTASSPVVLYCSLNRSSPPLSSSPSLGRHSEPLSTQPVSYGSLGVGLAPRQHLPRHLATGWPKSPVKSLFIFLFELIQIQY